MNPTERRRPVSRRRRLAHLGVGGVIAAAASAHIATVGDPEPVAQAAVDPPVVTADFPIDLPPKPKPPKPRPVHHTRASRSDHRAEVVTADWQAIAECESGGNPRTNTGNGYFGELQEDMPFWVTYDGLDFAPRPDLATGTEQILVATRARDGYTNHAGRTFTARGYTPWPVCGR